MAFQIIAENLGKLVEGDPVRLKLKKIFVGECCPVCFEEYPHLMGYIGILSCGHTCCADCCENLVESRFGAYNDWVCPSRCSPIEKRIVGAAHGDLHWFKAGMGPDEIRGKILFLRDVLPEVRQEPEVRGEDNRLLIEPHHRDPAQVVELELPVPAVEEVENVDLQRDPVGDYPVRRIQRDHHDPAEIYCCGWYIGTGCNDCLECLVISCIYGCIIFGCGGLFLLCVGYILSVIVRAILRTG